MSDAFNPDAYLNRIGYRGARTPRLDVLQDLVLHHTQSIPFENLNPFLGLPVPLDIQSIERKLVHNRRGGYCFEHNWLLRYALEAMGFKVKALAARVVWNMPEDAVTARSHMLLLVDLPGGPFLADVGFGGQTLTGVLRLESGIEQSTPHEPFRLAGQSEWFTMQSRIGDTWKSLYRFDLVEHLLPDYEVTNWYLSNHPNSHFVTGLIAARTAPGQRFALRNSELAIHSLSEPTERRTLSGVDELKDALRNTFGIALPDVPNLDAALARAVPRPVAV